MTMHLIVFVIATFSIVSCESEQFAERRVLDIQKQGEEQSVDEVIAVSDLSVDRSESNILVSIDDSANVEAVDTVIGDFEGENDGFDSGSGSGGEEDEASNGVGNCSKVLGVARVKVSGSGQAEVMNSDQAYFLKVTGNQNVVELNMQSGSGLDKIPGVCLDMMGNQNHIHLKVAIGLGKVYVRARGNHAVVSVTVDAAASVDAFQVNAAGKNPELRVSGDGTFPCTVENEKLPGVKFTCTPAL